MNYTYELFEVGDGFGYNVLCGGSIIIAQEYAPDLSGFIVMTREEATANAEIIIGRLEG